MVEKTRQTENIITITMLGSNRKLRIKNTQNRDDIPISLRSSDEFLYRQASETQPGYGTSVRRGTSALPRPLQAQVAPARQRKYRGLRFFLLWLITSTVVYFVLNNLPLSHWRY